MTCGIISLHVGGRDRLEVPAQYETGSTGGESVASVKNKIDMIDDDRYVRSDVNDTSNPFQIIHNEFYYRERHHVK